MFRKIKFRGISEGKQYYGLLTYMFGSYAIVDPEDENTVHLVDLKTVKQYTGMDDKNNIEIYDGDSVAFKNYASNKPFIGKVRYYGGIKPIIEKDGRSIDVAECNKEDLTVIKN